MLKSQSCFALYQDQNDSTKITNTTDNQIIKTSLGDSTVKTGSKSSDTLKINDTSVSAPILYDARDSIYIDVEKNQVHLFGDAHVDNDGMKMKAGYILIDMDKHEIMASHVYDKDSNKIELPEFTDGTEKMVASKLRINTETKKAYLEEARIQQDEVFLFMEVGKRQANEEIHFKDGRFTTCSLDEPHFHFQLSRAILIPDKKIVTGPMNLHIAGAPTPFGLPFSMIPQQKNRKHGIIFPQIVPMSENGFGFQDLGYYTPINEKIHTTNYLTLFSHGTWGVRNATEYLVNYKYAGNFDLSVQSLRPGFPSKLANNRIGIIWAHRTNPKSNPYWQFSSNVNFNSNNSSKVTLNQQNNANYFTNNYLSDINIVRNFPNKPITMSAKIAFNQNTQTKMMALTSPIYNLNVNNLYPFKSLIKESSQEIKQMVRRITVVYGLEFSNQGQFRDSLLQNAKFNDIQNSFKNGINQRVSVQTNAKLLNNKFTFSPSISYNPTVNFQQISKQFVPKTPLKDTLITRLHQKTSFTQTVSFSAALTSTVYSYYRFIGKNKPLMRHIMSPSVNFSYNPQLNPTFSYLDTTGINIRYSPYEKSMYSNYSTSYSGTISFNINNTFEMKTKSSKDSTGFRKFSLVEQLNASWSYNIFADSMKLSPFSLSFRTTPFPGFNITSSATLSPYFWNASGNPINKFAINENGSLGRITVVNITTGYTFTSKESQQKIENTKVDQNNTWNDDYRYFSLHPEEIIDFSIPWKVTITEIYSLTLVQNTIRTYKPVNTVGVNGDFSFTKRWKIAIRTNFDVKGLRIVNNQLELSRDMHCWGLSFRWVPQGANKFFAFRIFATGAMLSGLQQNFTKVPFFF